jgi:hypothetical protein
MRESVSRRSRLFRGLFTSMECDFGVIDFFALLPTFPTE